MSPDLDRAIDVCVAGFARTGSIEGAEFLAALRSVPGGIVHDSAGRELVDREQSAWLCEQILHRLVAELDGLAESELGADVKSAISTELRGVFDRVLTIADQRFGERR